jgi:hypothetical protein
MYWPHFSSLELTVLGCMFVCFFAVNSGLVAYFIEKSEQFMAGRSAEEQRQWLEQQSARSRD